MKMARKDLEQGDNHGRANALSNAKRAIESRIDNLINGYCFGKIAKNKNWNFPDKLDILEDLTIIAPKLLQKLITTPRNVLEYEYEVLEDNKDVKDKLDLADLYILGTEQACYIPIGICYIKDDKNTFYNQINLCRDSEEYAIVLQPSKNEIFRISKGKKYKYDITKNSYNDIIEIQQIIRDKKYQTNVSFAGEKENFEDYIFNELYSKCKK